MPTYEYKCNKCGEKFEIRRGIFALDKAKATCPKCGSSETDRVYSSISNVKSSGGYCAPPPTSHFG